MTPQAVHRPRMLLVTGGAGFIGSNYIRLVLEQDRDVRILNLDALTYAGSLENLRNLPDPSRHTFIQGDIADADLLRDLMHRQPIDTIVNFAAESHVDRSILGPAPFVRTNVVGTFTLLEAARQAWIVDRTVPLEEALFHQISTDEVYGSLGTDDPPFVETTPYAPSSPYAASKAAGDHLVRAYGHTYGLPILVTNCSNNYGPRQFPEKLIPLIVLNALHGEPLPVYGDGLQVRDWLYVEDHCEALWRALREGRRGETYNVGGEVQPTNLELVQQICALLDELQPKSMQRPHADLIQFVPDRPGHDRRYAMDTTKIRGELGWRPRHALGEGLRRTVRWYLDHEEWVAGVRRRDDYRSWQRENYAARSGGAR